MDIPFGPLVFHSVESFGLFAFFGGFTVGSALILGLIKRPR